MTKEELLEKFKNDFDNMGLGEIVDLAEDLGWEEESPEPNFVDKMCRSAETQANEWYDAIETSAIEYIWSHIGHEQTKVDKA